MRGWEVTVRGSDVVGIGGNVGMADTVGCSDGITVAVDGAVVSGGVVVDGCVVVVVDGRGGIVSGAFVCREKKDFFKMRFIFAYARVIPAITQLTTQMSAQCSNDILITVQQWPILCASQPFYCKFLSYILSLACI